MKTAWRLACAILSFLPNMKFIRARQIHVIWIELEVEMRRTIENLHIHTHTHTHNKFEASRMQRFNKEMDNYCGGRQTTTNLQTHSDKLVAILWTLVGKIRF